MRRFLVLAERPRPRRRLEACLDQQRLATLIPSQLPPDEILMQALAPNPRERPPVRKTVLSLERARAGLAVAAPRQSARDRHSVWTLGVAAASLALMMLGLRRKRWTWSSKGGGGNPERPLPPD